MMIAGSEIERRIDELVDRMKQKLSDEPMTPLERSIKIWSFQEPDRLQGSFAIFSPLCLGITEITTREFYTDPLKMYYCQALGAVEWHNEIPLLYGDPYHIEIEALGGEISFPEDSTPTLGKPLIQEPADLLKLKVPNPETDGRMPYVLELSRIHQRKLGGMVFAPTSCCGPFSLAVGLRGYKNILSDIRRDPAFVHQLLEFCCDVVITFGKALLNTHKASPTLQEAWSCLPNVSPKVFYEFCQPYIKRCVEALRNPATGLTGTVFYGWGTSLAPDWKQFLQDVCDMGMSALPITEEEILGHSGYKAVDLAEFKRICRSNNVVLMSFLHTNTLLDGPPARIKELVTGWFRRAASGGGYMQSCTIPIGAPRENVQAFFDAVWSCKFPVDAQ